MKYQTDAYLITCLTNMHVGSGEANYGVVDNLVQRDPITDVPIIHSSSLKGALREHCKDEDGWGEGSEKLNYIFGPDISRNKGESGIGHYKFFDANLIVLPVRSNKKPFFRATSNFLLKEIVEKGKALNKVINLTVVENNGKPKIENGNNDVILEDYETETGLQLGAESSKILGKEPANFSENDFKELSQRLPVIARNQLNNGESKNLWYEEVVPRESRFVFFVAMDKNYQKEFEEAINNKTVQIGGNASIGYGFCKIEKLS
ncbi:MAG: type III-B CRISPR module RAMP protein Cmr4 [Ignavibacteriaceae bacterium]|nr:type III-B CRISPR module RAMP protein Cmr4 [Ignavibacteriaceae bacterium]